MNTTIDSTIDTLPLGRRDRLAQAGDTAMSRRKLLGSAIAAAGAAGALTVVGSGSAAAAAAAPAARPSMAPRGAAPTLSPLMQYLLPTPYRVY
ncbi:MAG: hypothetical protein ABMA25_19935, partial [Ilumatobacteraceae bacterium]